MKGLNWIINFWISGAVLSDDDSESVSREASPCSESPRPVSLGSESPVDSNIHTSVMTSAAMTGAAIRDHAKVFLFVPEHSMVLHQQFIIFFSISHFQLFQVTVATQTGHDSPDFAFDPDKMTTDKHCYECKVRYRDPKPQDLVMYLHAWKYQVNEWLQNSVFFLPTFSFTFFSDSLCIRATSLCFRLHFQQSQLIKSLNEWKLCMIWMSCVHILKAPFFRRSIESLEQQKKNFFSFQGKMHVDCFEWITNWERLLSH